MFSWKQSTNGARFKSEDITLVCITSLRHLIFIAEAKTRETTGGAWDKELNTKHLLLCCWASAYTTVTLVWGTVQLRIVGSIYVS